MKKSLIGPYGALFMLLSSSVTAEDEFDFSAYDGEVIGIVDIVIIKANLADQSLGITLEGSPPLCGTGTHYTTYLSNQNTNFGAVVSAALSAKHTSTPVRLVSDYDATLDKCQLKQIQTQ